jgi:hypothetical protein
VPSFMARDGLPGAQCEGRGDLVFLLELVTIYARTKSVGTAGVAPLSKHLL